MAFLDANASKYTCEYVNNAMLAAFRRG